MTTSNKNFKVKNGLEVLGTSATVNGNDVITSASNIEDLANVSITGAVAGNALVFDSSLNLIPGVVSGGGGSYTVSDTPPSNPNPKDIWFNSATGATYIRYEDQDSTQWVQIGVPGLQGPMGPRGFGVAAGGVDGQILAKVDGEDYITEWIDNYAPQIKHIVKAGEALTKGQAVYVSSANGTNMIVSKASNSGESMSSKTMGLIAQTLANNGQGFVVTEGLLSGLNTASATAGDPVWLGTSGNLIYGLSNKPVAPAHLVYIGVVTRVHATQGEIFVKVQNGYELNELHDVSISSVTAGDLVVRNSENTLWENMTLAEAGVSAVGHTHDDRYYTEAETDNAISTAIANVVDSAPEVLNTLNELAASLNDDANFASTVTTALAGKSDTSHIHDDRYYTETETNNLLSPKANLSGAAFTGTVSSPSIGLGGITSPTHKLESNGRIKLRSDGSLSSGIWMTGTDGTETVFLGQLGNSSSDAIGIYHSGAWRFYTTATLTTLINDTEVQRWRGHLDRSWDNYPSITIFNTTDKGPQSEFRLHGYPGSNGGDYSIVMRSDGGYVTGSDLRRKTNIEQINNALDIIGQISGKKFNIINSDGDIQEDLSHEQTGKKFGLIAQEVIDIIPEAVKFYPEADTPNENGYASAYSIDYSSIVPLLIQGINELKNKVEELESKMNGGI